MRESIAAPVPPNERTGYEREMEMVRNQLGMSEPPGEPGHAYERVCAEGRAMTSEQAVACILEKP